MKALIADAQFTATEKRAALRRILDSVEFSTSARARDFLTYIVEEEIAGRSERLKGYTIATEALGKAEAFNADVQSAVRVQAKRLREQLDAYYRGSGRDDEIVIDMPRGGYVPIFRRTPASCGQDAEARDDVIPCSGEPAPVSAPKPEAEPSPAPPTARARSYGLLSLLALAAAIVGVAFTMRPRGPGEVTDVPVVVIVAPEKLSEPRLATVADRFVTALRTRLSRYDDVVVTEQPRASVPGVYEVEFAFFARKDGSVESVVHVDDRRDQILFSQEKVIGVSEDEDIRVASAIAEKIAAPHGVIYADMLAQPLAGEQKCVVDSYEYFRNRRGDLGAVEDCLRNAIAANPRSARALTALSRVLLEEYRLDLARPGQADPLAEADALAMRAAEAAPQKGRPFKAIFEVRFFQKRFDEAFEAAQRALELNPDAADILYRVAAARITRGDFAEGRALLERARKQNPVPPAWMQFFFVLEALDRGDAAAAARAAETPGIETTASGLLARALLEQRRGDAQDTRKTLEALAQRFPQFAADLPRSLERLGFAEPVRKQLLAVVK